MKRYAFTLIEILFVLVIIGILVGVAFYSFKINYIKDDVSFILMKLERTKYQALNYDKSQGGSGSTGCISLKEDDLKKEKTKTKSKPYKFRSSVTNNSDIDVLCFDIYGNLHDGENDNNTTTVDSLIHKNIVLTIKYNDTQEANITILNKSGYMMVNFK